MRTPVEVKICGLTRRCDVELAAELGAGYVGFVLVPASPRCVPVERLRELTGGLPAGVKRVGVFADADRETILRAAKGNFDIIQLHGEESSEFAASLPYPVWKAVRAVAGTELEPLAEWKVERFLFDAASGGSGRRCDWSLAAQAARRWRIMLAGGLSPENIREAIQTVHPVGVDLSSSLETALGIKSEEKMKTLFKEIVQ